MTIFGEWLRTIRCAHHMSTNDLSLIVGVSSSTLRKWEISNDPMMLVQMGLTRLFNSPVKSGRATLEHLYPWATERQLDLFYTKLFEVGFYRSIKAPTTQYEKVAISIGFDIWRDYKEKFNLVMQRSDEYEPR